MIDDVRRPEEYENLISTLANVFVGSLDQAHRDRLFDRISEANDNMIEQKLSDLELRASLFESLV